MTSPSLRPAAVAAALLTAAALGTTAFALPAMAEGGTPAAGAQATAAPVPVTGGSLDWGLLDSYRNYVQHIAQGTITAKDGAEVNRDGTFRFTAATGQYDKGGSNVVKAAFKGSVTFESKAHGFTVTLDRLRIDSGTKTLTADVTRNGKLAPDVVVATVEFAGEKTAGLKTTLTKELADLLGPSDYAGREGDRLTAALEFPKPPTDPTPSAPVSSPAPKPSPSSTPSPSATPSPSVTPSASATPPADGPQQLRSGKLAWGVKESFRTYVTTSGGTVTPEGGAAKNGDSFSFSGGAGTLDAKAQKLHASFQGGLRFQDQAHHIDLTFANVRIDAQGAKGTLVLDVKNAAGTQTNVSFATLDLTKADYKTKNGVLTLDAVRAALTAEGAAAFSADGARSDYHAGDRADDVNLTVSVDKDAPLPTPSASTTATTGGTSGGSTGGTAGGSTGGATGGNLASTGSDIPAGVLLAASGAVVAAGAGAVCLGRRRRNGVASQN
ncbi:HtaA domain-containing protein [Streptomyces sp. NPDC029216]|uniref:HtaA domain-containing protein n=1 Tax=Streptomyces sp. NPDC029216 TaxID=3154701 RepID=UPI0033D169A8